jgi:hypothetical protein
MKSQTTNYLTMKNFVKENWYKLMIGSSMMMASFGFMIYAISPAYSNSEKDKTEIRNTSIPNAPIGTNGVIHDGWAYFVDGGNAYSVSTQALPSFFGHNKDYRWIGNEFYRIYSDGTKSSYKYGLKTKLPL